MVVAASGPYPVFDCSKTIYSVAVTILKGSLGRGLEVRGLEVPSSDEEVTIQTLLTSQSEEGPSPAALSLGTKYQVAKG